MNQKIILPEPSKIPWTSSDWKDFLMLWSHKTDKVPERLLKTVPQIFKLKNNVPVLNRQIHDVHTMVDYASAIAVKYAIQKICENRRIYPIVVSFTPALEQSSSHHPYIATDDEPLHVKILIDSTSYSAEELKKFEESVGHNIISALSMRDANFQPNVLLYVEDVHDYPLGYASDETVFAKTSHFPHGLKAMAAIQDNPRMLHAWRSATPNKYLIGAAAAGGVVHKAELYLRWLEAKENPEKVKPLDEKVIEQNWPGAMHFFHAWASLGIRSREHLKEAFSTLKTPQESLGLPPDMDSP